MLISRRRRDNQRRHIHIALADARGDRVEVQFRKSRASEDLQQRFVGAALVKPYFFRLPRENDRHPLLNGRDNRVGRTGDD